jgi:GNAT superfamily N-acetyltransferase
MIQDIGFLDLDGIRTAAEWARREGWNPGLGDAEAFAAADPDGFLGLKVAGELAATISLVHYGEAFAFLGFYIARPEFRGRGLGLALWNHALARSPARTIGLDGVKAQQPNYRKSGFVLAHENIRYGGPKPPVPGVRGLDALSPADAAEIARFEAYHRLFPERREAFLAAWLAHDALALRREGELAGYGVIRPCHDGHKIGPLFAAGRQDAERILAGLLARVPDGMVFLDVPETNPEAVALAKSLGLAPMFETARMYRGPIPDLDTARIFGITSFELG